MIKSRLIHCYATVAWFSVSMLAMSSASAGLTMRIDTENNFFYIEGSDSGNGSPNFSNYDLQFLHTLSTRPPASVNITNTPQNLFEQVTTLPISGGNMNMIRAFPGSDYIFIDLSASSDITTLTGQGPSVTVSYAGLSAENQAVFESMIGQSMSLAIGTGYSPISVQAVPTIPDAPTITGVVAGDGQLTIAFTAGADNGSAITNYEYSLDGGSYVPFNPADTNSPVVISGLTNGTAYAIQLQAVNGVGQSAASNSVSGTPLKPPDKIFHSRFAITD